MNFFTISLISLVFGSTFNIDPSRLIGNSLFSPEIGEKTDFGGDNNWIEPGFNPCVWYQVIKFSDATQFVGTLDDGYNTKTYGTWSLSYDEQGVTYLNLYTGRGAARFPNKPYNKGPVTETCKLNIQDNQVDVDLNDGSVHYYFVA
jgi:hypothetical protein